MALSRHRSRCGVATALLLPFLFVPAVLFVGRRFIPRPSISLYSSLSISLPPPPSPPSPPSTTPPSPPPTTPPPPTTLPPPPPPPPSPTLSPPPPPPISNPPPSPPPPSPPPPEPQFSEPDPPPPTPPPPPPDPAVTAPVRRIDPAPAGSKGGGKKCDLYQGRWERDEEGRYPLYAPGSCPYVDQAYACQENGRTDVDYMKWRWKPDGCSLPRFNPTDFLERIRGKKVMLVGDSMNRNQYESLLCLLREALPDKSRMYETRGFKISKGRGYFIFLFLDYNCTVVFVRSHFLVKEGVQMKPHGGSRPTLAIDRIDKSATRWKKADILIFNTGHWWTHGKTARGKDYYQEGGVIYPQFDAVEAFRRAMKTWGKWIDRNMNPKKKLVFYRGYSNAHFRGGDWDSGGTCNKETDPIMSGPFLDSYPLKMKIVEEVIRKMRFPVILLNVTRLTNFRKDGHPSYYGKKLAPGQRISRKRQDCSHWCLPGVPDAWNELIYATLVLGRGA